MGKAYVWRAAIIAAVVNVVLNPGVAWLETRELDFVSAARIAAYLVLATMVLCLLISTLGARRVHRELRSGHPTPHGGTAEEKRLLAKLPATPWLFGLLLGLAFAVVAIVVIAVVELLDFHGFAFGTFVTFMVCYTGGLAFLVMRWTIVRQLMEAAARVG
ncbi:MAG TPA: hypothetical protein VF165_02420 [Nocardioidaceae bacterium]